MLGRAALQFAARGQRFVEGEETVMVEVEVGVGVGVEVEVEVVRSAAAEVSGGESPTYRGGRGFGLRNLGFGHRQRAPSGAASCDFPTSSTG